MKILHLSDLHFGANQAGLGGAGPFSKRLLGLSNLKLNPKRKPDPRVQEAIINQALALDWDYLILSGDLTHLGTKPEFDEARTRLEPLITKAPGRLLLTAGNHDRYVLQSLGLLEKTFGDCFPFNQNRVGVPHLITEEGWLIAELPMARPAWGAKGQVQLEYNEVKEFFLGANLPVLLYGHYPLVWPAGFREPFTHSLWAREQWAQLCELAPVAAYLHGHVHQNWAFEPPKGNYWAVNAGGSLWSGGYLLTLASNRCLPPQPLWPLA